MKRKVSIIIPAYNVEKYISRGLNSCINQSYTNIEILVINDGSTDNTKNIVKKYCIQDKRIKLFNQKNKGVSSARNLGIKKSVGDYCVFLDGDDWLEYNAIRELIENQHIKENCFVICSRKIIDEKDYKEINTKNICYSKDSCVFSRKDALLNLTNSKLFLQSSCYKLFSLKIIKENSIYFDEKIYNGEDGLLVFEYLHHVNDIYVIPKKLWVILNRNSSFTNSKFNPKKLTNICAIEKMLAYNSEYDCVRLELKKFLISKAVSNIFDASMCDYKKNRIYIIYCRNKIKLNIDFKWYNLHYKFVYFIALYFPVFIIKFLIIIRNFLKVNL